jgi:hypothetical protein
MPKTFSTIDNTTMTARLVRTNSAMRFMDEPPTNCVTV